MTISSATRKAGPFLGNGVTNSFPFTFKVFQASDLQLIKTNAAGTDFSLLLNSDYSIALNADQNNNPGGTITYPLSGTLLATGEKLTATGALSELQNTHITNGGNFFANNIEDQMDYLTILVQQHTEKLNRAMLGSTTDIGLNFALGTASARANKNLSFDGAGNPLFTSPPLTGWTPTITFTGAPTDVANVLFQRAAAYSGGTPGFVNSALKVQTDVTGVSAAAFEWAFTSVLNNYATGGQNVAIFGQGNSQSAGAGPTFAGVFEGRDLSGAINPTKGRVSVEIDRRDNGTDSGLNRVALDIVCSRPFLGGSFSGAAATIGYGVRVGNGGDAGATIGAAYTVFNINVGYAFDCGNATVTGGALRMPANAAILFDTPGVNQLSFDGAGLVYKVSGAPIARFNQNGTLNIGAGAFGAGAALISQVVVPTSAQNSSQQIADTLAGTTTSDGVLVQNTIAAAVTAANYRGVEIRNPVLNAGALITNLSGIYVNDLTQGGTLNAALNLNVVAAAGKYNIYAPGTAQNFFAGPMSFGTFTLAGVAQTGYITITDSGGTTRRLLVG